MAYRKVIRNKAKELYIIENKTIEQIANILRISWRTIIRWKKEDNWEIDSKKASNIGIVIEMQKALYQAITQAIRENNLTDPSVVDAIYKTSKMIEKMLPKKMMLANIFNMLEDIVTYINSYVDDDKFSSGFAKYLPEISEFLRKKYADE